MLKICKFGGSSVSEAAQFKKVKEIVQSDPDRRYIVVSAAGKRNSDDNKITDLLYLVDAHRTYHVDCSALLDQIEARFQSIADELSLSFPVHEHFDELRENLSSYSAEYIISRGEWFTARLMAEYLGIPFFDAEGVVIFNHDGSFDMESTKENVRALAAANESFVFPGFYGSTPEGEIRLMERGGGDISGAILASAIGADLYENWTDVSGFLAADPRIVDKPRSIERITFDEMRELSYMGASVLHEDAIFPVRDAQIPIQIKNTNEPDARGTTISETAEGSDEHLITGIAGMKGYVSIYIAKSNLSREVGAFSKALGVFARYGINVEHMPTGIDSFCVIVRAEDVDKVSYALLDDVKKEIDADEVSMSDRLALISVVGRNIGWRVGFSGRLFTVLGETGVNIRMISQSSQEISIIMGVDEADFERAIRAIYDRLVESEMVEVKA